MNLKEYKDMICSIVVPGNLSVDEQRQRYQPLTEFINAETPEKLYRFRRCDERSFDAFDQDKLFFSPGYKMNDDFDSLLYYNKESIKNEIEEFSDSEQLKHTLEQINQGVFPDVIHNVLTSEIKESIVKIDSENIINKFKNDVISQINEGLPYISQSIQKNIKFACFSENINSALMWGYYADNGKGFALSYDFRNGQFSNCNSCNSISQCVFAKNGILARVIYGDKHFDATKYAVWLFQQEVLRKILIEKNAFSFYNIMQYMIPCPDMFAPIKVLLHKASVWEHEQEWRLSFNCVSQEINQQEFPYSTKRPSAVYLGRKISPIHEKILRHIAVEKNIPVFKMTINENEEVYKLFPKGI